jgi:uncharacterized protein (DUF1697 family)
MIYIALLRAVNVGGTGKLLMPALRSLCVDAGFRNVRTYIASGNVVLESGSSASAVKQLLEERVAAIVGKPVGVAIRTSDEMARVLARNPLPDARRDWTVAIFLDSPPPSDVMDAIAGLADEEIRLGDREIYVRYPSGMGRSRLRIPAASLGTERNINTIAKLVQMAASPHFSQ